MLCNQTSLSFKSRRVFVPKQARKLYVCGFNRNRFINLKTSRALATVVNTVRNVVREEKKANENGRIGVAMGIPQRSNNSQVSASASQGQATLPIYVSLDSDTLASDNNFSRLEGGLRLGLKALRAAGISGILVDVYWCLVEDRLPVRYNWATYRQLFRLIRDEGFLIQVCLAFHSTEIAPLPAWIRKIGQEIPDIFFTDKNGNRSLECLSLGIDDLPLLGGRTAIDVYSDFMASFRNEFRSWLGTTVTEITIGLGPEGELRYPSHPRDKRWSFPGIGEFQCYDKPLLARLRACAMQAQQPSWGLGGPHDAGAYDMRPQQTGFFHPHGNWSSAYGKFFLQWYSDMLVWHADLVLGAAARIFNCGDEEDGCMSFRQLNASAQGGITRREANSLLVGRDRGEPQHLPAPHQRYAPLQEQQQQQQQQHHVSLNARMPLVHWWHGAMSRAAELTSGFYDVEGRDGYLQFGVILAKYGMGVHLRGAELAAADFPSQASCAPEGLVARQRTVAAAMHLPVTLTNASGGGGAGYCSEDALRRLEMSLFDDTVRHGIETPQVHALVFHRLDAALLEPQTWARFRAFLERVLDKAEVFMLSPLPTRKAPSRKGAAVATSAASPGGKPTISLKRS